MALYDVFVNWWRGGRALAEMQGQQFAAPGTQLVADTRLITADAAMQIAAVWLCVGRRANIVASLPCFTYTRDNAGQKTLARNSRLYKLLHDSPNQRMTAFEFWRTLMMNYDLRGNAYARIERDATGEATALWPMPADQVSHTVLPDGSMVYAYQLGNEITFLAAESVLHIKDLGNGTTGLPKLEYMRATTDEAAKAQATASKLFGANGKPSGVLMVDQVLKPSQREALRANFGELEVAPVGRLFVLEANMKYQQLALSPEDQQLLGSRQFGIEEICRWFDVPPVLAYHSNVTTWGSGVEQIVDGWHRMTLAPLLKNIESAIFKRVLTSAQRASMVVEFSLDALLRGNPKDRAEIHAKYAQNGVMTRAEIRQLENLPVIPGADELTAQTNLAPLSMLGKVATGAANVPSKDPIAQ
jgi:HK97 family phage portal protein